MANTTRHEEAQNETHPLADVEELRVDLDEVFEAVKHECMDEGPLSAYLSFSETHAGASSDGTFITAAKNSRAEGVVRIRALAFLTGHEFGSAKTWDRLWEYPDEADEKYRFENSNADTNWEGWWREAVRRWEGEVKAGIKNTDSITFQTGPWGDETPEVPVTVTEVDN